jgi:hypothetical protein
LVLAVASRPEGTAGRAERDSQRLAPSRFPPPPQAACELESCAPVSARKTPPVGTAKKAGWQSRFVPTKSALPLSTAISVDHGGRGSAWKKVSGMGAPTKSRATSKVRYIQVAHPHRSDRSKRQRNVLIQLTQWWAHLPFSLRMDYFGFILPLAAERKRTGGSLLDSYRRPINFLLACNAPNLLLSRYAKSLGSSRDRLRPWPGP